MVTWPISIRPWPYGNALYANTHSSSHFLPKPRYLVRPWKLCLISLSGIWCPCDSSTSGSLLLTLGETEFSFLSYLSDCEYMKKALGQRSVQGILLTLQAPEYSYVADLYNHWQSRVTSVCIFQRPQHHAAASMSLSNVGTKYPNNRIHSLTRTIALYWPGEW